MQIINQLNSTNYSITKAQVRISLNKQGMTNMKFEFRIPFQTSWDIQAKAFDMVKYRTKKTALKITN